jgi:hypothetical protein
MKVRLVVFSDGPDGVRRVRSLPTTARWPAGMTKPDGPVRVALGAMRPLTQPDGSLRFDVEAPTAAGAYLEFRPE